MINDSDRHPHPVALRFLRAELDSILTEREALVIKARFGLDTGVYCQHCHYYTPTATSKTLEEAGREFGVTRERIRQIEAKAIRKLKGAVTKGLIKNLDDCQDAFPLLSKAIGIQPKAKECNKFADYVLRFYGTGGIYQLGETGATREQVIEAINEYLQSDEGLNHFGDGDSIDRERVRDILINKFNLTFPESKLPPTIIKEDTPEPNHPCYFDTVS
tara:strand:+ start:3186 stop:3836 length:651 start_codon:yes stop_codon:yes gene_type:complete